MVDSAMAASQNGFFSYKLSLHYADYDKKIKIFIFSIFYYREIVKIDHFMTLSLSYANTVL
jgi:hypothetical protein